VWSDAQGGYPVDSGANNTKTMLLASAEVPKTPASTKLRGVYDPKYYDVVEQRGQESRVKIITVDNSSDAQTYKRVFGHSVIVVDGIAYNMSPSGFNKIPFGKYLYDVTNQKGKPSQGAMIQDIKVSNQEVERIKTYLQKPQGKYNAFTNNCSTVCKRALDKGLDKSIPSDLTEHFVETPTDFLFGVENSKRVTKFTIIKPKKH
jgi:hypothetical protein